MSHDTTALSEPQVPAFATLPSRTFSVPVNTQEHLFQIRTETALLALLLSLILLIRVTNLEYNTLFVDEAIYVNIGEEALQGVFKQAATGWIFGSYLYPTAASLANKVGGVLGLRVLSALLTTIAAWLVYLTAKRAFNTRVALWALLFFGLTGVSISLGQLAVIDVMVAPFLALCVYYLVVGLERSGKQQKYCFFVAGLAFTLATLSKYITLACLPATLAFPALLLMSRGHKLRSILRDLPWLYFFLPVAVILGGYLAIYFNDLMQVFSGQYSTQIVDRGQIVKETWEEIGPVIPIAYFGAILVGAKALSHFENRNRSIVLICSLAVNALIGSALAIPCYQFWTSNIRSLWKHDVYSLIFLAPFAGYGLNALLDRARLPVRRAERLKGTLRLAAVVVTVVALYWFIGHNLDRNWGFQYSWPDEVKVVNYVKSQGVTADSKILASGSPIYEYYIHFGLKDREIWQSTWYMEYKTLTGVAAMKAAIQDCALDAVILDDYYTPEINPILEPLLVSSGYGLKFTDTYKLSFGEPAGTRVYIPLGLNECRRRIKS